MELVNMGTTYRQQEHARSCVGQFLHVCVKVMSYFIFCAIFGYFM